MSSEGRLKDTSGAEDRHSLREMVVQGTEPRRQRGALRLGVGVGEGHGQVHASHSTWVPARSVTKQM